MSYRLISAFLAAVLLGVAPVEAGEVPAGMLIGTRGVEKPAYAPFSELPPGARMELGADGEARFVHYGRCKDVTARGGSLSILAENFDLKDGKIIEERDRSCPRKLISKATNTSVSGVVVRNYSDDGTTLEITMRPGFVIVGAGGRAADRLEFKTRKGVAATLTADGRRVFRWPEDLSPLDPGREYQLVVRQSDGPVIAETDTVTLGTLEATKPGRYYILAVD